jgi:hypothetical protein
MNVSQNCESGLADRRIADITIPTVDSEVEMPTHSTYIARCACMCIRTGTGSRQNHWTMTHAVGARRQTFDTARICAILGSI